MKNTHSQVAVQLTRITLTVKAAFVEAQLEYTKSCLSKQQDKKIEKTDRSRRDVKICTHIEYTCTYRKMEIEFPVFLDGFRMRSVGSYIDCGVSLARLEYLAVKSDDDHCYLIKVPLVQCEMLRLWR